MSEFLVSKHPVLAQKISRKIGEGKQKKVLSLVLCVAMMLSVMVVGAGAAFSDQSKIKNTEAVDACTALNIIGGYPDGSFKPEGNITRAEVTKMICVALNGGKNPAVSTNTTPTFSDVRNNANAAWAEGYIESCAAQGIVSGVGGGKFAPNGNVTGVQLAKMLLVSLGYKSENEGFTGNAWATNVNVRAAQKGLYDGLEAMDTNAAITRDNAAQMVWNALQAYEVEYKTTLVTDSKGQLTSQITVQDKVVGSNNDKITLLEDKYEAETVEDGILTYVKEDSKGTYTVWTTEGKYTKVAKDYSDMLGQKVDVLVKNDDNSKVYGIYATDDNTVAIKTTAGQIDTLKTADKTLKVDGTKYNLDNLKIVYTMSAAKDATKVTTTVNNKTTTGSIDATKASNIADALVDTSDNVKVNTASTVYLVSNDGDNKIDIAIVIPAQVAKVNYVGSDSITLGNGIGTVDEDDYVAYKGIAKSDYVLYTAETDGTAYKDTLTKVDVVSGKVDAVKNTTEAKIAGTYYKKGTNYNGSNPKVNDKVNAAVYAGRYYDLDAVSEASSEDILFVTEAGPISSGITSGVEASVLFADGTSKTIVIDQVIDPVNDENEFDADKVDVLNATEKTSNVAKYDFSKEGLTKDEKGTVYVGAMYTYELDGSKYDITPLRNDSKDKNGKTVSGNDAGYDKVTVSATAYTESNDNSRLAGKRIDDNAIIFVAKKLAATGTDAKVITGKELKTWDGNWGTIASVLSNTKNGVDTVMVGAVAVATDSYGSEAGKYGIVTSDLETIKVNGSSYVSFNLWNGSENVQTITKTAVDGMKKGSIVKFDADGSEGNYPKIKGVTVLDDAAAMLGAEANGNNKYDVTLSTTGVAADQNTYTADSDTTVLFISDDAGVKGGSLTDYAAMESSVDDVYVQNAVYVTRANKDKELDLIVIDIRGKLALSKDLAVASNATATVDLSAKTIVFKSGPASSAITNASVKALFDNALAASKISDGKYTVVANDGSEYTFSVSVAPSAP